MIITNSNVLNDFAKKHGDVLKPLIKWIDTVLVAKWQNHNDLKLQFPAADYIGNSRYVFNLKGNNYRIVVIVVFFAETLDIRFIGTHAEYDKIEAKYI